MLHIWIISSGIISIISVCILYILNKDNIEGKNINYRNIFITILVVSILILSFSQSRTEKIVPNISDISNVKINNKPPF